MIRLTGLQTLSCTYNRFVYVCIPEVSIMLRNVSLTCYYLQVGHNPSALDFLADVANSAGNHVAGETSRGTAAAAVSAGPQPINGILKVHENESQYNMLAWIHARPTTTGCFACSCNTAGLLHRAWQPVQQSAHGKLRAGQHAGIASTVVKSRAAHSPSCMPPAGTPVV